MEERGRALRRHHRRRVIHNRLEIKRDWFRHDPGFVDDNREAMAAGLAKYNLACSCGMCAHDKWSWRRRKDRRQGRALTRAEVADARD
jgi:hypothetical protein